MPQALNGLRVVSFEAGAIIRRDPDVGAEIEAVELGLPRTARSGVTEIRLVAEAAHARASTWAEGDPALAIAESVKEHRLAGRARFALGQVLHGRGDYAEVIRVLGENVEATSGDLKLGAGQAMLLSVASRAWLAFALGDIGRFREAIDTAQFAIRQTESPVQPFGFYHACWALCAVHLEEGEHERAVQMAARMERISAESGALRCSATQGVSPGGP